jgi:enterochelin esterase-like enzyme
MKNLPGRSALPIAGAAVLFLAAAAPAAGQAVDQGQVIEGLRMKSAVLGRDVSYAVYLPPDYQVSKRRYPVVYLLHGYTDDESGWIQFGEIGPIADRAIAERRIPPMIIVMPDGGVSWYINDVEGKVRYEDMFVGELIPFVDASYRTRADRQYRGVSGLSMGGWGTLIYALRHPELFASCAAFSAAVWTDDEIVDRKQEDYDRMFGSLFGPGLAGKARLTPHFRKYNPLDLAKTTPQESLKKVDYYIDCGDDDFLIKGNCALNIVLMDRKIPHEFRVRDGAHTWEYWRAGIVDGLAFIGESFRR